MTKKKPNSGSRGNPPPHTHDEQPLLRVLVAEATRRGDTLASLAKTLGVTYARLAQWRRNEAAISHAKRDVHENAGRYLGIPTVLVLIMAGIAGLNEFVWPSEDSLKERVERSLERLRLDPFLGGFVPPDMADATPAVKLFVVFLIHEMEGDTGKRTPNHRWLRALYRAAAGNAEGQLEVEILRKKAAEDPTIF
jgi:transcriptional regulator with XRE-family HTH domain